MEHKEEYIMEKKSIRMIAAVVLKRRFLMKY